MTRKFSFIGKRDRSLHLSVKYLLDMNLERTLGTRKPIIGMVHLGPLPGAPSTEYQIADVITNAVRDARALADGGVDGVLIENWGDAPFYPDDVPKDTVAAMTRVTAEIADSIDLPFGINVLRNDAEAALSIASVTGGAFIRVNVHTGARITDQGLIQGTAHRTLRHRSRLGQDIAIWADLAVKHSSSLSRDSNEKSELLDLASRGLADGIIVSGASTGRSVEEERLRSIVDVRDRHERSVPIILGSGIDTENVERLLALADAAIIGTAFKEGTQTGAPVEPDRVSTLVEVADSIR